MSVNFCFCLSCFLSFFSLLLAVLLVSCFSLFFISCFNVSCVLVWSFCFFQVPSLSCFLITLRGFMASNSGGDGGEEVLDLGCLGFESDSNRSSTSVCLAGKLITEKSVNLFALIDVMKKAFRAKGNLQARDWGNGLVMFSFEKREDRNWVLRNQPWHFDGHLFAVKALDGTEQPSRVHISGASFWMRAHDLPLVCRSVAMIKLLAGKVGVLEAYESPANLNCSEFLRFKVHIDVTQPLRRGIHVKLGENTMWVPFTYEALPYFCYRCGRLGHLFKVCPQSDKDDDSDMLFTTSLKAPALRRHKDSIPEVISLIPALTIPVPPSVPSTPPQQLHASNPIKPTETTSSTHSHLNTVSTERIFETLQQHLSISDTVSAPTTQIESSIQSKPQPQSSGSEAGPLLVPEC